MELLFRWFLWYPVACWLFACLTTRTNLAGEKKGLLLILICGAKNRGVADLEGRVEGLQRLSINGWMGEG